MNDIARTFMNKFLYGHVFSSVRYIPRNGIVGSDGKSLSSILFLVNFKPRSSHPSMRKYFFLPDLLEN